MDKVLKVKEQKKVYVEVVNLIETLGQAETESWDSKYDKDAPYYFKLYKSISEDKNKNLSAKKDDLEYLREKLLGHIEKVQFDKDIEKSTTSIIVYSKIALIRNLISKGLYDESLRVWKRTKKLVVEKKMFNFYYELFEIKMELYTYTNSEKSNYHDDHGLHKSFFEIAKSESTLKDGIAAEFISYMEDSQLLSEYHKQMVRTVIHEYFDKSTIEEGKTDSLYRLLGLYAIEQEKYKESKSYFKKFRKRKDVSELESVRLFSDLYWDLIELIHYSGSDREERIKESINGLKHRFLFYPNIMYSTLGYFLFNMLEELDQNIQTSLEDTIDLYDELQVFSERQIPKLTIRIEVNRLVLTLRKSTTNGGEPYWSECINMIKGLITIIDVIEDRLLLYDLKLVSIAINKVYDLPMAKRELNILLKQSPPFDSFQESIALLLKDVLNNLQLISKLKLDNFKRSAKGSTIALRRALLFFLDIENWKIQ